MRRIIDIELGAGTGHFFGVVFLERHLWIRLKNEFKFDPKTGVQVEHDNKIYSSARNKSSSLARQNEITNGILIRFWTPNSRAYESLRESARPIETLVTSRPP